MNTTLMSVVENIKNTKKYKEKQDILSLNEKKMLSNYNILKNYKILGFKTKPTYLDLTLPIYTIFIREGKKYLLYHDKKNKKKILEIFKDTVQENKNYELIFDDKSEKCYYLENQD